MIGRDQDEGRLRIERVDGVADRFIEGGGLVNQRPGPVGVPRVIDATPLHHQEERPAARLEDVDGEARHLRERRRRERRVRIPAVRPLLPRRLDLRLVRKMALGEQPQHMPLETADAPQRSARLDDRPALLPSLRLQVLREEFPSATQNQIEAGGDCLFCDLPLGVAIAGVGVEGRGRRVRHRGRGDQTDAQSALLGPYGDRLELSAVLFRVDRGPVLAQDPVHRLLAAGHCAGGRRRVSDRAVGGVRQCQRRVGKRVHPEPPLRPAARHPRHRDVRRPHPVSDEQDGAGRRLGPGPLRRLGVILCRAPGDTQGGRDQDRRDDCPADRRNRDTLGHEPDPHRYPPLPGIGRAGRLARFRSQLPVLGFLIGKGTMLGARSSRVFLRADLF